MSKGKGRQTFGEYFATKRRALGMTLREFCRTNGFDVGNISKVERGKLAPPHGPKGEEKLTEYAHALGIKEGSGDWFTFFDLASIDSGMIPKDIQSDEKLIPALPLLFRTLRDKSVSEEDLDKIINIVKEA